MSLDTALASLERAQIVRRLVLAAEDDLGALYRFKHSLTQEAAYRSLPRRQRQQIHQQVAECYEALFPARLDDYAAVLAYHFGEAGDDDKALSYSLRAGDLAMAVYASAEALMHFDRALEIVSRGWPATAEQLDQLFGQRGRALELESRFEDARDNYTVLEQLALARKDPKLELAAVLAQTQLRSFGNQLYDPVEGLQLARRALALAETLDDRRSQAEIYWNLMNQARFDLGRYREAVVAGEHALEIARAIGWQEQTAFILNDIADVYADAGQTAKGIAALDEARQLFRELGNQPMLADSLTSTGVWRTILGDFRGAITAVDEALGISARIRNIWGQAYSRSVRGMAYWRLGEYAQAIEDFTAGAALADEAGFLIGQILPRVQLAFLYHDLGGFQLGLATMRRTAEVAVASVPQFAPVVKGVLGAFLKLNGFDEEADAVLGDLEDADPVYGLFVFTFLSLCRAVTLLHAGRFEEVVELCDRYGGVMQARGIVVFATDARLLAGRALLELGRNDEARQQLTAAREEAASVDQRRLLWQVLPLLADLEPDAGQAAALRGEAAAIMAEVRDQLPAGDLRDGFLALPDVQRTLASG